MRKNVWWIVVALFVVGSCGACAVGLNKAIDKKANELNENLRASRAESVALREAIVTQADEVNETFASIRDEMRILNQNLAEVKTLNQNLVDLTGIMTGVQIELKILNQRLEGALKFKKLISP